MLLTLARKPRHIESVISTKGNVGCRIGLRRYEIWRFGGVRRLLTCGGTRVSNDRCAALFQTTGGLQKRSRRSNDGRINVVMKDKRGIEALVSS